jgi:hypothetical protein
MRFLKAILFYPLLMIRRPVLLVGKVLAWVLVLGGVLPLMTGKASEVWGFSLGGILSGVLLFVLCQFYDELLLRLNPTGRELVLYQ